MLGRIIIFRYDECDRLVGYNEYTSSEYERLLQTGIEYDANSRIKQIKNDFTYLNGTSRAHDGITKAFTYFNDDKLQGYTVGSDNDYLSVSDFTYDTLDRVSKIEYTNSGNGSDIDISVSYGYGTDTTYGTSGRITSYSVYVDGNVTSYTYYYNDDGNITKITSSDGRSIVYTYDSLGQLISEDNDFTGYYYTYTYDKAGNLTQTSYGLQGSSSGGGIEFNGIDGDTSVLGLKPNLPPLNPTTYNTYTYTDSEWGDLLTSYNGTAIEYDEIGNPRSYYNGYSYSFAWEGRRLVDAVKGTNYMSFAYNDAGLRISKTANDVTTHYVYDGDVLLAEYTNNETIVYIYDAFDSPIGFAYRSSSYSEDTWDVYWYEKNLLGDIVAVYSSTGTKLVSYTYTAWGDFTTTYHNGGANTTAVKNNLTYRGYYYDSDLGMYYLQSRYYDPVVGRFISPDSLMSGVNGSLHGFNLYAYCFNNPVSYTDSEGNWPEWMEKVCEMIIKKYIEITSNVMEAVENIKEDIENYDKDNDNESVVLEANYFSSYRGTFVIRFPLEIAFSYGFILLGYGKDETSLKHEFGHKVQFDTMGIKDYTLNVALPSFVASWAHAFGMLPYDYYTSPWESEADSHGGVIRETSDQRAWMPSDGYYDYLLNIFK